MTTSAAPRVEQHRQQQATAAVGTKYGSTDRSPVTFSASVAPISTSASRSSELLRCQTSGRKRQIQPSTSATRAPRARNQPATVPRRVVGSSRPKPRASRRRCRRCAVARRTMIWPLLMLSVTGATAVAAASWALGRRGVVRRVGDDAAAPRISAARVRLRGERGPSAPRSAAAPRSSWVSRTSERWVARGRAPSPRGARSTRRREAWSVARRAGRRQVGDCLASAHLRASRGEDRREGRIDGVHRRLERRDLRSAVELAAIGRVVVLGRDLESCLAAREPVWASLT